jgi:hypothetical protein
MTKWRWVLSLIAAGAIATGLLAATSFGAGSTGAVANFAGKIKIEHSSNTTPTSAWSTVGHVSLPVGSWVINAHTVVTLASSATQGTDVECDLTATNAQMGYTATGLTPVKANDVRDLSAQTLANMPNGGTAALVCRLNDRADSKLVLARGTSIIATSVAGTSQS